LKLRSSERLTWHRDRPASAPPLIKINEAGRSGGTAATDIVMTDTVVAAPTFLMLIPIAAVAAALSAGLILLLAPWLRTYALARPNARSSHIEPTPQGGGGAVIVATFAVVWAGALMFGSTFTSSEVGQFAALTAGAALLAMAGAIDDIRPLAPLPRLLLQGIAAAAVIAALPEALRLFPLLPWWGERALLLLAGVWFINLTNFMDGIDLMTVAEVVPIAAAIVVLAAMGKVSWLPAMVALALGGAMLGFAPFNWPVARLFLGDVGSLPIGLVLAWLLLQVAGRGELAAALILPLYYVADATLTLLRRLAAREPVWQAHRTHFYQRALSGGYTVPAIIARVLALNLALAVLAIATAATASKTLALALLIAAAVLVALRLLAFARGTT
jgi:UDP-N-acetylmuramyl pentapeptide phosphotransferase/UDP-N-acetylglucosamine-1-phosphate transferase